MKTAAAVNLSTMGKLTPAVLDLICKGASKQFELYVGSNLNLSAWQAVYSPDVKSAPADSRIIYFFDHADQAGALGYHDEKDPNTGLPFGKIFIEDILSNGGTVNESPQSIATTFGHEFIELATDQNCATWVQCADGSWVAFEPGDPFESDAQTLDVGSEKVWCTNFAYLSWFDVNGLSEKSFDWMGLGKEPLKAQPDGYTIRIGTDGKVTTNFGEKFPSWKMNAKMHPAGRTARRVVQATKLLKTA